MSGSLTIPNNIGAQPGPQIQASLFDTNWSTIASYVNARELTIGLLSARPGTGSTNQWYFATDTNTLAAWNGTTWVSVATVASGVFEQFTGLGMTRTSGSALTVAIGACTSDDATLSARSTMSLLAATQGNTGGTWVVGTNQNKLDAGVIAINTWYHVFVIERTDTGVVDILFSLSPTAPALPTNYTKQRRIGSFKTDAGPNILDFTQDGDYFVWRVAVLDVNTNNPGVAAITSTLGSVPTGVNVWANIVAILKTAGISSSMLVSDLIVTDAAPTAFSAALAAPMFSLSVDVNPSDHVVPMSVRTNTSAQVRYRLSASDANVTAGILTQGWIDRRGRG